MALIWNFLQVNIMIRYPWKNMIRFFKILLCSWPNFKPTDGYNKLHKSLGTLVYLSYYSARDKSFVSGGQEPMTKTISWHERWIITHMRGWSIGKAGINLMYIWWSNLPHDPMIANSCLYKKVNHFVEKPLDFLLRPSDDPTAATDWRWRPCFAITNYYQGCTQFTQSSTNNLVLAILWTFAMVLEYKGLIMC